MPVAFHLPISFCDLIQFLHIYRYDFFWLALFQWEHSKKLHFKAIFSPFRMVFERKGIVSYINYSRINLSQFVFIKSKSIRFSVMVIFTTFGSN